MLPMTYEGIRLLHRWREDHPRRWHVPPLERPAPPARTVTLLELMPGAFLKAAGLPYKPGGTVEGRRTVVAEVFLGGDDSAIAHAEERHREERGPVIADFGHRHHAAGAFLDSPDRAAPDARVVLVEGNEVVAAADALAGVGPEGLKVLREQRQGIPEPPGVEQAPELGRQFPGGALCRHDARSDAPVRAPVLDWNGRSVVAPWLTLQVFRKPRCGSRRRGFGLVGITTTYSVQQSTLWICSPGNSQPIGRACHDHHHERCRDRTA